MSIVSASAVIDKVQDAATREALYALWTTLAGTFNQHTHVVGTGAYSSGPTKHTSGQTIPPGEDGSLPG